MTDYDYDDSRCGCGCFSIILEIAALIIICNICGCRWAELATEATINYIHRVWNQTTPTPY